MRPTPAQVGQVEIGVCGSAPSPAQRGQVTAISNGTLRVVPFAASLSSISTVAARSAPRDEASAEQVVPEERGEEIGEAAEVEMPRLVAAAAKTGVPVTVVEIARFRFRKHLVRLDDLTEAFLRIGRSRDIGMQLACERAEGLLDL